MYFTETKIIRLEIHPDVYKMCVKAKKSGVCNLSSSEAEVEDGGFEASLSIFQILKKKLRTGRENSARVVTQRAQSPELEPQC